MTTTPAMPELLTDTDVARIFRRVYGGSQFDSTERMFAAEVEAAVRGRFATLQAQPAEVSDAEIRDALEAEFLGEAPNRVWEDDLRIARAILALRPQAVPMTDGAKRALISNFFAEGWAQDKAMDLLHDYDMHHGITQRADGGEG